MTALKTWSGSSPAPGAEGNRNLRTQERPCHADTKINEKRAAHFPPSPVYGFLLKFKATEMIQFPVPCFSELAVYAPMNAYSFVWARNFTFWKKQKPFAEQIAQVSCLWPWLYTSHIVFAGTRLSGQELCI